MKLTRTIMLGNLRCPRQTTLTIDASATQPTLTRTNGTLTLTLAQALADSIPVRCVQTTPATPTK